jgi:hypothetical protein
MTIQELESLYVTESGDKKPDIRDYKFRADMFRADLLAWNVGFNKWLSQRLERVEKEKEIAIKMYKECLELYIPDNKQDEANLFLSTYVSLLAKDMAKRGI